MKILLISGFLGAGKTTFIKELIKRTDTKPIILENEYGDNNLDSVELKKETKSQKDIKVLEFMEGCVCCTMKDSFVNSVFTVFSSLSPEYLIIEPTGVGKLSNIINNLKPLFTDAVSLLNPVVVLSPDNYDVNSRQWPDLYKDQIANAKVVVLSKCENTPAGIIADVTSKIRKLNPAAEILDTHYLNKETAWWNSLMEIESKDLSAKEIESESVSSFSQVSVSKAGLHNIYELIQFLEDCLHSEFGLVARAKGTLWVDTEFVRFDLADNKYIISGSDDDTCQCVIIGQNLDEKNIKKALCPTKKSSQII
ncbi:MAG: GTP-binding protein [Lachnospiraceae bacterium]|nr:GTP-binding protein [Lachnospiraceae bacterium]